TFSNPSTLDATSVRVDHAVSSKLTLFARYNNAPSETIQRGSGRSLNTLTLTSLRTQTLTGGATWAISPAVSNDFRTNYSRNRGTGLNRLDDFGGATPPLDSVVFPSFASSQDSQFFLSLSGGTTSSFLLGKSADNLQEQVNLIDTLSVVRGSHQLKFGVDYRRLFPVFDPLKYTQQPFFNGVSGALTGRATSVSILGFAGKRFPRVSSLSLFGQDSWKLTQRLTLTYGLRWELNPPPSEQNGNLPLAITGVDNPAALAFAPPGTPLYKTAYHNFAPRAGLAYQLSQTKGRETILRGGFGIFYDLGASQAVAAFGNAFPNRIQKSLPLPGQTGGVPFPLDPVSAALPSVNLNPPFSIVVLAVDPNLELPYTYQWNFGVEESLGSNQTVSASYVAAAGRRLYYRELLLNPNPNFTSTVFVTTNLAASDYHALQLQFQRRLSRGLQALASYTWSHSLDTASNDTGNFADVRRVNLEQERGPSDFDVRHSFSAAVTYDIPAPLKQGLVSALLRNFSIDTIFRARSATPVNIV